MNNEIETIRNLSYYDLTFSGIGSVVGAGIFVLIGKLGKYSGKYAWLSMLLAGIIIFILSRTYIKLNKKYDSANPEMDMMDNIFGHNYAFVVMLAVIISGILSCYITSNAFGEYFHRLSGINPTIGTIVCVVACIIINIFGIKHTVHANTIAVLFGIIGFTMIIVM